MDTRQNSKTRHSQRRSNSANPRRQTSKTSSRRPSSGRKRTDYSPSSQHSKQRRAAPNVVYTPAKPFSRNRFLLQLATVVAVVIAITLGISIFFKVEAITVSGNEKYSAWVIREASGIQDGDNLLTFSQPRASSKILSELPYVKDARIGIKLPNTVNIYIEEYDVVYAARAADGTWWLLRSDGVIVEQTDVASASDYTKLIGIELESPWVGEQAAASETAQAPETTNEPSGSTDESSVPEDATEAVSPVAVTGQQRLETALNILQYLEDNDIIGDAASVDVTDLSDIQLWYGEQYQVKLGGTDRLEYKIEYMKDAIDQLEDYQSGILDVSFKIWTDKAGYTPF